MTNIIMIANIALGASLQQVFEMIKALQIVILLPLTDSSIPANAGMFFN